MGTDNGPQNTWGEWRRHLRSGPEQQLVRDWYRRLECPTCKAVMGRACRTSNGHPADHHRARRDAAGPLPYEQWKQRGLWAEPKRFTMPAVLKEAEKARTDYNVDLALGDGVAVVRIFLAERLGIALKDEATLDRIDDAVRQLLQARGPARSADLVTVLASLIATLLSTTAGPDGDPEALFDSLISAQVNEARRLRAIEKNRSHG
ncbi:zinc finger domain-containing protein [Streptomyces jumonjinensis]|uniref:DNA-binding phage zinc finger domain-containing protein n=1 Tax=Streptomyces jumonjinensis TaxID=1945 RepID=A0A646KPU4_STRJU|nr:hypothetical protein [Streptomyces jumonjinensis]MQT03016.1 hypothetical protein [Streptomyces jumonjinensis]